MPRLLPILALLLSACAPAYSPPTGDAAFRAAFSADGVAWVAGGRACVARAPGFRVTCPSVPTAVDVAWNRGEAWAAVPGAGVVVTLDRAARSVAVGRVVALSSTRAYREDGSAVTYEGAAAAGVAGAPSAALTGGDGADYVLLAGNLRRVTDNVVTEVNAAPFLVPLNTGARSADVPTVVTSFGTYRLANGRLERGDGTGRILNSVAHGAGRVGQVGSNIVTISADGSVKVFTENLNLVDESR
ncbi:hypothetical protein [Deinococcus sp. QL22]|uniref:hypothetical protein n=1 Tax=Deinococcus sp. QL22 TaxID=2939437 RepID=UPI0020182683|nr:hypothetical protein [Deinococcus sp. QL22]UQN07046.1 hypothetical protein M1R55_03800 [Deinococcus sp. QL22]